MYPITNEVKALFEAEQPKVLRITGTDRNGATISITDDNVIADSFQIDRYSCNGEKLEVGTAVAAQMTMTLENGSGTYDAIAFEGAELFAEVGVADWTQANPTIHWVPCGYFTPDEQPRRLSTISITALDRMTKFDVVVDGTGLTFPTTVAGLVGQVCTLCGVTLAQSISGLVNAGVTVTELPTAQDEITYRNLIQWCAGIMGTNAWFDWNGQLRFSWYENATGYVSTVNNRYSSDLYEDDLTVSGVEYTNDSGIVIVEGTDDYAIDLTGNAIVGPLVATVLPPLNTALNGFTYRPFTAAVINAPYLWPMDVMTFTDKNGNDHTSVLTNVAFGLNGTTALEAKGMTYAINKAAQPKGFTREQAQLVNQAMEHVEQDIDESLTQQEIFNRLTDNGAAQGLVLYNGQLYINASYINAGYMSANHIQGGTLTLGGQNNQNGVLRMLNANGDEIGYWNNNGIAINSGSINLSKTEGNKEGSVKIQQTLTGQIELRYSDETSSRLMVLGGISAINIIDSNSNDQTIITEHSITLNRTGGVMFSVYEYGGVKYFIYNGDYFNINADVHLYQPLDVGSGGTGATTAAGARANLGITPANIGAVSTSAVIDVSHGGTGATTAADARTNLGVTPANIGAVDKDGDTIDGDLTINGDLTADNITLTNPLEVQYGGTGETNANDAANTLITSLPTWNATPTDDTYFIRRDTDGTARYGQVKFSTVYDYIKNKATGTWGISITGDAANVTGTVAIDHGGTGKTNANDAANVLIASLPTWSATPTDTTYLIRRDTTGTASYGQVTFSTVYDYIKTKTLPVGSGGTGATTAAGARANLGIQPSVKTVTTDASGSADLGISTGYIIDYAYVQSNTLSVVIGHKSNGNYVAFIYTHGDTFTKSKTSGVSITVGYHQI